ncbi:hypothetical protein [Moorena sp. SIO3H5]|uniref:hypothetical protein n=1 Tax=Moorena sp. SIO3H5 TaxID=2607834 RepID=UPI0025FE4BD5|nr:hypothetical protein [Moorena sp. SIO3H5]
MLPSNTQRLGIGGHCLFHCSPFNKDHFQQFPPYKYPDCYHQLLRDWVLVGIAYFMARRSIKIIFSNSHPTSIPIPDSRFPIPDSRFPIPLFKKKNPNSWGFSIGITTFVKKVSPRQASSKHRGVVTEDPEVARVSRQFIAANRPPSNEKKDF